MQTQDHFAALLRPAPAAQARHLLARLLQSASRQLDRLAAALGSDQSASSPAADADCLEFHADAAAPEGALYVNGQLVGHITGIRRL